MLPTLFWNVTATQKNLAAELLSSPAQGERLEKGVELTVRMVRQRCRVSERETKKYAGGIS